MPVVKCFFLLLIVLWTDLSLHAQTASSAIVLGRVVDSSSAVVPDAQVTLRSVATNATRLQTTNNVGQYVFSAVPPGAYILTVTKTGFETGVATLEQRSRRRGIGGVGPDRCGIASSDQNLLTSRWLEVVRGLQPFARSSACRSVPFDL